MRIGVLLIAAGIFLSSQAFSQENGNQKNTDQTKDLSSRKSSIVRYSITVHGKVQGVGFRDATKERAEELGLKGLVRNDPDGTVYIEAEGRPEEISEFLEFTRRGPQDADVENVEVKKMSELKNFSEFDIHD